MSRSRIGLCLAALLPAVSVICSSALSQQRSAVTSFVIDNHHLQTSPSDPNVNISVGLSVGGGPLHYAQVDTGSVGVLVSRDLLGPSARATGETGAREFNSSGRVYQGRYYRTTVELHGRDGTAITVPLRVLAVDALACDQARTHNCTPSSRVRNFVFLGVGFDRPPFLNPPAVVRDALGPPDNPFLQLAAMDQGRTPRRYTLARDRVVLGAADADVAGFRLTSLPGQSGLAGNTLPSDWNRVRATYALSGPAPGERFAPPGDTVPLLVDTGVEYMILTVPPARRPPDLAQPGSEGLKSGIDVEVAVSARSAEDPPALTYRFRTGAQPAPAGAPTRVRWGQNGDAYQINTGSNLLNAYDYLYDSDRGLIGFRPR